MTLRQMWHAQPAPGGHDLVDDHNQVLAMGIASPQHARLLSAAPDLADALARQTLWMQGANSRGAAKLIGMLDLYDRGGCLAVQHALDELAAMALQRAEWSVRCCDGLDCSDPCERPIDP